MNSLLGLIIVSVIVHGFIAGASFDVALVKLPARKRIGAVAYARFARGNDLGNGLIIYPAFGIVSVVLAFGALALGYFTRQLPGAMLPLMVAVILTVAHSLCTAKAAPIMLSLRNTPDEEGSLQAKLDRFAFWHAWRAAFQAATFIVLVWALVVAR
jgi:hypothetical protein